MTKKYNDLLANYELLFSDFNKVLMSSMDFLKIPKYLIS